MLGRILQGLEQTLDDVKGEGASSLLNRWKQHDWLTDCDIEVNSIDGIRSGRYAGLDGRGRLKLVDQDGRLHVFWSADVKKISATIPRTR